MAGILTLGELLIDLTQTGSDANGNGVFTAFPGGAPANVAVAASRLGAKSAFIGKVGDDSFGRALAGVLEKEGVDTRGLYTDKSEHTTLAIVAVDETGERDFAFYRSPGADTQLTAEEAVAAVDANGDAVILHVGSLSLTNNPSADACRAAVEAARAKGICISYDPNYRAALWSDEETAIEGMKSLLSLTDVLKVSEEEMEMLTGSADLDEGSAALAGYGIKLVMVTLGGDGMYYRTADGSGKIPGEKVTVKDTNGAGDTFLGATLSRLAARDGVLSGVSNAELEEIFRFANRAAARTCAGSGAIPAMPYLRDLTE